MKKPFALRGFRAILILSISTLFIWTIVMNVQAETNTGPFKDQCPRYPVCLMSNVKLNTKYGQITSLRNMIFNRFEVDANGTIFFDASSLIPNGEEILLFNLQSYGNGTMDVRILSGIPAIAADCQGCPIDSHLSANLLGGEGAEFFLSGNMPALLTLTINYTPFGGACIPGCISNPFLDPRILALVAMFLAGAVLIVAVFKSGPAKKPVEESEVWIGRDEEENN